MDRTVYSAPGRERADAGSPLATAPDPARRIDVGWHLRNWAGFKHLALWAAIHVIVALIGIYFFLMGDHLAGFGFVVISVAILFYGIATIDKARRAETRDPPL